MSIAPGGKDTNVDMGLGRFVLSLKHSQNVQLRVIISFKHLEAVYTTKYLIFPGHWSNQIQHYPVSLNLIREIDEYLCLSEEGRFAETLPVVVRHDPEIKHQSRS